MSISEMIILGIEYIYCLFDIVLLDYYEAIFHKKKEFKPIRVAIIVAIVSGLLFVSTCVVGYSNGGAVLALLLMYCYSFFLFEGNMVNQFFSVLLYYVMSGMIALLITLISMFLTGYHALELLGIIELRVVVSLFIRLFILLFGIGTKKQLIKQRNSLDYLREILIYWLMAFVVLFLLYECLYKNEIMEQRKLMMFIFVTVMTNFVLVMRLMHRFYKARNDYLITQIQLCDALQKKQTYVQSVHEQLEVAKFRHDLKNHLLVLYGLIESNDQETSIKYIRSLYYHPSMKSSINTNNEVVNVILNAKKSDYPDITFKVRHDGGHFIVPIDKLTIILGNAIDNAIEATRCCVDRNKEINVNISENSQFIKLYLSNPYAIEPVFEKGYPVSSKKSQHQGLGVKNILDAVKSMNGEANFSANDGVFIVIILLMKQAF